MSILGDSFIVSLHVQVDLWDQIGGWFGNIAVSKKQVFIN